MLVSASESPPVRSPCAEVYSEATRRFLPPDGWLYCREGDLGSLYWAGHLPVILSSFSDIFEKTWLLSRARPGPSSDDCVHRIRINDSILELFFYISFKQLPSSSNNCATNFQAPVTMVSSYGKHTWFHRGVGVFSIVSFLESFYLIFKQNSI